jgi:hypothetical protein
MLTQQQLIDAGFKKYINTSKMYNYDILFQKKIQDAIGTKYFINVCCWDRKTYMTCPIPEFGFNCDIQFTNGTSISHEEAVNVEVLNINKWSPEEILKWAENLFWALGAFYNDRGT